MTDQDDNKWRLQRLDWRREVRELSHKISSSGRVHLYLQRTGTTYDVGVLPTKHLRSMIARGNMNIEMTSGKDVNITEMLRDRVELKLNKVESLRPKTLLPSPFR